MTDRDTLAAARRALGATLIRWPEVVAALGEDRAHVRVDEWAARVDAVLRELEDAR